MLKIGEFSKLARVSIRMLRHYDEIGLLHPEKTDPFTGYRFYSESQLPLACRISSLKEMGFSLAEIREMLSQSAGGLQSHFALRRAALMAQAEETAYRIRLLDTAILRLRKDDSMPVMLKTLPRRTAACVRMTIPRYEDEGMLWGVLMAETAPLRLIPGDPCLCSVTFHDGEWKETDVDVEAQKTVMGEYPDTEHVKFRTLDPVTVASATYQGSYELIGDIYASVYTWIEENGYAPDGPMMNIYHVSPHETNNPAEFVTEVCCPVRKK